MLLKRPKSIIITLSILLSNCTYGLLWGWFLMLQKCYKNLMYVCRWATAQMWKGFSCSLWFLNAGFSVSQVQIIMEELSMQEWTETRTGVWTSPEPPDPAFSTWGSPQGSRRGMVNFVNFVIHGHFTGIFSVDIQQIQSLITCQYTNSTMPLIQVWRSDFQYLKSVYLHLYIDLMVQSPRDVMYMRLDFTFNLYIY